MATSTLTRFARILKNNCGSAHRASKQIIQSIGCSRDVNNCMLAIYSFEFSPISSQAEISKCDMVATNGVAHQVGKDFINGVQVMPRKQTSTSIEELKRQKKIICILSQKVDALLLPRPSGRGQAQVIEKPQVFLLFFVHFVHAEERRVICPDLCK